MKAVTIPNPRPRSKFEPETWRDIVPALRKLVAIILIVPTPIFFGLFVLFVGFGSWGSFGPGSSEALDELREMEGIVNLIGVLAAAAAWCLAVVSFCTSKRSLALACMIFAGVCMAGGVAAENQLRRTSAQMSEIDPSEHYPTNYVREARVYWKPLAGIAAACAVAILLLPPRRAPAPLPKRGAK